MDAFKPFQLSTCSGGGGKVIRRRLKASFQTPMFVKGYLGIVSLVELAFIVMFVALLCWSLVNYYILKYPVMKSQFHAQPSGTILATAAHTGLVGNVCFAFIFFPVTRLSSLLPLVGLTVEGCVKYHMWLGHTAMLLFATHGVFFAVAWAADGQLHQALTWTSAGISNVAGEIALVVGAAMWATALRPVRRRAYEAFFYTHQLYFVFTVFYLLHIGISNFFTVLPGFYLFLLDRYLRFLQSRRKARLYSARILPCDMIELNFAKSSSLTYAPLSIIFVNIPSLSRLQWHPFTVASSSSLEPETLSVVIKKEGSWTSELLARAAASSSSPGNHHIDASVEGPYSPPSVDFMRYDSLVMVSGGSGITPFISIIREVASMKSDAAGAPPPRILLICSFKASNELSMLNLLLPMSSDPEHIFTLQLQIEAFVTREKVPRSDNLVETVFFKPRPTDLPVAAVLGPRGWLWLAAVIAASFAAYIVLLAVLTNFYLYPNQRRTGSDFSYSVVSAFNVLFILASIAAAAGAAVRLNSKWCRREEQQREQMQSTDAENPFFMSKHAAGAVDASSSPMPFIYNIGDEFGSTGHDEFLFQSTNVHFGRRPNLREMLLECRESNIGVMASGPAALRHEVASICVSSEAENLHFESISFSW